MIRLAPLAINRPRRHGDGPEQLDDLGRQAGASSVELHARVLRSREQRGEIWVDRRGRANLRHIIALNDEQKRRRSRGSFAELDQMSNVMGTAAGGGIRKEPPPIFGPGHALDLQPEGAPLVVAQLEIDAKSSRGGFRRTQPPASELRETARPEGSAHQTIRELSVQGDERALRGGDQDRRMLGPPAGIGDGTQPQPSFRAQQVVQSPRVRQVRFNLASVHQSRADHELVWAILEGRGKERAGDVDLQSHGESIGRSGGSTTKIRRPTRAPAKVAGMDREGHKPLAFERRSVRAMRAEADRFEANLQRRRSVRAFSPDPIPLDVVRSCIRSAATAPSGANKQPWTFVLVTDPEVKKAIRLAAEEEERAFYGGRAPDRWLQDLQPFGTDADKPFLEIAPALIVVFAQKYGDGPEEKHYYVQESVGIATGMLLAALQHAGLASLTHTPSPMAFLAKILGRPASERPFLLIPIGYPADDCTVPDIRRKSERQVLVEL